MTPVATLPHKSNGHERYLPKISSVATQLPPDIDLEESDTEAGALQLVNEPEEAEWDGFDDDEDAQNDGAGSSGSDADSIQIHIETQKREKPILPKDVEEEELERMVFGDAAGFKQGLDDFSLERTAGAYDDATDEDAGGEADLEAVADQDLFFFDTGPVAAPGASLTAGKATESDHQGDKPAWEDSDDERLVVSLASVPQLKKLRETAEDDLVNGREYARRLRKQYERLYPTPEWALHAAGKANKKRRRTLDDDESGEESASDMDLDDEELSSQPLARLLKDADILSRNSTGPGKRRKLQAGTVDIQRLKDVAKAGPVSDHITSNIEKPTELLTVCHNLTVLPSHLSHPSLFRTELNPLSTPRKSQPAEPESASYLSPHQTHASYHRRFSSVPIGLTHLSECTTSLFSYLEHRYWQGGEGHPYLWSSARAAYDGTFLDVAQRQIHGSAGLFQERWWRNQHSRCQHLAVGHASTHRVAGRRCGLCMVGRWKWPRHRREER